MKHIAVFCSAYDLDEKYTKPACEFASLMPKNKYDLVWGGSDTGLMNLVASAVQNNGGKLIGISLEAYRAKARQNADEMIIAKTLGERKATMLERADAIIVLVGGIGTLDEATEIIELKKQKHHNKPIVILNTENFYEGLKVQLQKMKDDGFIPLPLDDLIYFADKPSEAIEYINIKLQEG
ncbi:MAG: TIGR00730 family Rossman fold protein [Candidatus Levybacteria bacterium]|nr:TIGR00730 family Rossman fold protein [Candidatus Levybacteria bacterium]